MADSLRPGRPAAEPPDSPPPAAGEVAVLRAAVARLAEQVDRMRATVAAAVELAGAVEELRAHVAQLLGRLEAADRPALATVAWVDVTPDRAPQVLAELADWMSTVLVHHRVVGQLLPCWYRHPALVQVLLDTWVAWLAAYRDPAGADPPRAAGRPLAALDWSQRHLPHLEQRVRELLGRCSTVRHQHLEAPDWAPVRAELDAYARWWAGDRDPASEPPLPG